MESGYAGFGKGVKMIEIKNVTKIFNEHKPSEFKALKDVTFHVKKGEICVLKGVSGSGKSTLLGIIAGIYRPSFGEVLIDNKSITKLPENFSAKFRRDNIGIIFQNFNLIPTLSVNDNILLPTIVEKDFKNTHLKKLLKDFGLEEKANNLAKDLSGGEAQRVAIIRSLINSPKVVLCDEPTANLDKNLSIKLLKYFKQIKNLGYTLLIATHDDIFYNWSEVDKIVELQKGKD